MAIALEKQQQAAAMTEWNEKNEMDRQRYEADYGFILRMDFVSFCLGHKRHKYVYIYIYRYQSYEWRPSMDVTSSRTRAIDKYMPFWITKNERVKKYRYEYIDGKQYITCGLFCSILLVIIIIIIVIVRSYTSISDDGWFQWTNNFPVGNAIPSWAFSISHIFFCF